MSSKTKTTATKEEAKPALVPKLRFPEFHEAGDCGFCGTCKAHVVRALQRAGHKVLFCGDGTSDRHGAEAADAVFAREGGSLVRWCAERSIPHTVFRSFDEVMDRFPA